LEIYRLNIAPKTAAAGLGGSLSIVVLWILGLVLGHWQIVIPPEVAGAFATLISTAASYYAPASHAPPPPVDNQTEPEPVLPSEKWNTQK
jgi:hypothetical protein